MEPILHFDAAISPNRSLSRRGFQILIGVLIAINLAMASFFLAIGALPIPFFLGLDVLGVATAFAVSYRGARQLERVQVSAQEVRVLRELGKASSLVWRSPTAFTRVAVERTQDDAQVRVSLSGRSILVGGALSPGERVDLGGALERAILAARAERPAQEAQP